MLANGGGWGVVVSVGPNGAEEVLLAKRDLTHALLRAPVGTPTLTWAPVMAAVLSDASPAGAFWGPTMSRLRNYLDNGGSALNSDAVVRLAFYQSSRPLENVQQFHQQLGRELVPVRSGVRAFPGCLLFGPQRNDVGVLMSDNSIWGLRGGESGPVKAYTWDQFRPLYLWFPHP